MKKFCKIACLALLVFCFVLGSCGANSKLNKISKNLNTYDIKIEYNNEDKTASLNEKLTYKNASGVDLEALYLHLYPNAFSEDVKNKPVGILNESRAYPNGKSYGGIEIENLKVNGKELEIEYFGDDKDFLKVNSELKKGNKVEIEIDAKITLPNIKHRFGYTDQTINFGNFYPIMAMIEDGEFVLDGYHSNGDPFYSDVANYNVQITADENLILANSGEVLNKNNSNSKVTYNVQAKVVRDFAFVLSDKFEVVSGIIDGVEVKYYYYDDENYGNNLKTSMKSIETFNKLFGEYPYKTLSVVKADFVHGGMEFPNLVYISSDVEESKDYTNVIVHEIAHQWWYGVVGNNEFKNSWLDEGLTEYSTLLFYENNESYGVSAKDLIKASTNNYSLFVELYTKVLGDVNTTMNRRLDEFDTEPEYTYITYVKGMLFFDNIRELIGNNAFFNGLKVYYSNNAFEISNPDKLLEAFEKASGKDLKGIFDSWIDGKISILSVDWFCCIF